MVGDGEGELEDSIGDLVGVVVGLHVPHSTLQ